ncbi:MAG: DUF3168 domain-containing protein [Dehalococcoidia bacterium]
MSDPVTPDPVLAMITALKATAAVTAIVSTKIYRTGDVPTNPVQPYIVVSDVSDVAAVQLADARVQCSCFAASDRVAFGISNTIRKEWHRKKNTLLKSGVRYVWIASVTDAGNQPDHNEEVALYAHHRDLLVNYDYR